MGVLNNRWFFSGTGDEPQPIANIGESLRFRGGGNRLNRTFTQAGSATTFTMAVWVKMPSTTDNMPFMVTGSDGNNDNVWEIQSGGQMKYEDVVGGGFVTFARSNSLYRDPTAWYHAVFVADTNNATAADRIRIFINGQRVEMFQTNGTWPVTQGYNFDINSAIEHAIGAFTGGGGSGVGYLADYYFIDGQALEPTAFGLYDTEGVWVPRAVDFTPATLRYSDFVSAPGGLNASFPATNGFDGDTDSQVQTADPDVTLTFAPTTDLTFNTSLEVWLEFTGDFAEWNGNTSPTQGSTEGWVTVFTGAGTINQTTPLTFENANTNNTSGFNGIRLDGTVLLNPFLYSTGISASSNNTYQSDPANRTATVTNPENAFNGVDNNGAFTNSDNQYMYWVPPTPLTNVTSLGLGAAGGSINYQGLHINGVDTGLDFANPGGNAIIDISEAIPASGEITEIAFFSNTGSTTQLNRVEVNGQVLIEGVNSSYGPNGFHLTFSDPNDIGADSSGNNNNWTSTGINTDPVGDFSSAIQASGGTYETDPANRTAPVLNRTLTFDGPADGGSQADSDPVGWWYFPQTFSGVTSLAVDLWFSNATGSLRINGAEVTYTRTVLTNASLSRLTVTNPPANVTEIACIATQPNTQPTQILINGQVLTDNNGEDYDLMQDSPSQNFTTLSPVISTAHTNITDANLQWSSVNNNPASDTIALPTTGNYYFEATLNANNAVIGITQVGDPIDRLTVNNNVAVWLQNFNAGTAANATITPNSTLTAGSATLIATPCVLGVEWDATAGTFEVFANGVSQYTVGSITLDGPYYVQVDRQSTASGTTVNFNFGQIPFLYRPTGLTDANNLQTQNLPTVTIKNGTDHFRALTASGASILDVAQGNLNGYFNSAGFSSGLWCIKDMDNTSTQYQFVDAIRGKDALIKKCPGLSNTTAYQPPTGDSVAWCWQASDVMDQATRESGDITVTAGLTNQTAGFSILEFEGNAQNDQTLAHGLTAAPEFMIAIAQDNTNSIPAWHAYAPSAPSGGTGLLNSTGALSLTHVDAVDNQFITISSNTAINSGTVSMYLWHSVPGYSAFGQYTGNSSADGPFIYTGFKPSWILIKRASSDASGHWTVYDSTRSVDNPAVETLRFDVNNGEGSGATNAIDFLSNGFKIRTDVDQVNASVRFVYAVFASNPFGGSNINPNTAALAGPPQIDGIVPGIAKSLRFKGAQNLVNSNMTWTSLQPVTFSFWVKITNPELNGPHIWRGDRGGSSIGFSSLVCSGTSTGLGALTLNFQGEFRSDTRFRDPGGWMHIVISFDGTNITMYRNGVADRTGNVNSLTLDDIEFGQGGWIGYLAEVYCIDGIARPPSLFAGYNADGVWVPVEDPPIADYGTNGFKLVMDPAYQDGTTLQDQSGNGNNFTMTGFDTDDYFSADFDFMKDGPSQNFATLNVLPPYVSNVGPTFSNANLAVNQSFSNNTNFPIGTVAIANDSNAIYYAESTFASGSEYGVILSAADGDVPSVGGVPGGGTPQIGLFTNTSLPGNEALTVNGTALTGNPPAIAVGDVISVAISGNAVWYAINGEFLTHDGSSFATGPFNESTPTVANWAYTGLVSAGNSTSIDGNVSMNYGQQPFLHQPAGTVAFQTQNLPAATVIDSSDEFQVITGAGSGGGILWAENRTRNTPSDAQAPIGVLEDPVVSGNGNSTPNSGGANDSAVQWIWDAGGLISSATITFQTAGLEIYTSATGGVDSWTLNGSNTGGQSAAPDVITPGSDFRYIRFRGTPPNFGTNWFTSTSGPAILAQAQAAFTDGLWWIKDRDNSNQHQLVDSLNGINDVTLSPSNVASAVYAAPTGDSVAWCWKYGEASTSGFNIIRPTVAESTANQTVAHGCPSTPEFIIWLYGKNSGGGNTRVWHTDLTAGTNLWLNTDGQENTQTGQIVGADATNITFSTGTGFDTDPFQTTMYVWSPIPGYSAFGTYQGNLNADNAFVYLGFKPAFLLTKLVSGKSSSWGIWDSTRSSFNPNNQWLAPNTTEGERTNYPGGSIDFLSNGFKIRNDGDISGNSIGPNIYAAFAENPFGGSNTVPATAR